jgi:hypothetical protein
MILSFKIKIHAGIGTCNQGMQGGTGIPESFAIWRRLSEDMPGKSLQDSFSLKAQPFTCGTLACDFN